MTFSDMLYLSSLLLLAVSVTTINAGHRIYGGKPTTARQHSYQVSLLNHELNHFCGGALVRGSIVLTAAHCLVNRSGQNVYARAGIDELAQRGFTLKAHSWKLHPKFTKETLDYDVAVIILENTFRLTITIWPIRLVPMHLKPEVGEMLTVTGWGITEETGDQLSPVLRALEIPLVTKADCEPKYANARFPLTDRMMCAGGTGAEGVFKGDSGGPAIDVDHQLVGIISWGKSKFTPNTPAILTDLTNPEIRAFVDPNIA